MFSTFGDFKIDKTANKEACRFLRRKVNQIVTDPHKASILKPKKPYARRPLYYSGYYQIFNRSNINVINLLVNPSERLSHPA